MRRSMQKCMLFNLLSVIKSLNMLNCKIDALVYKFAAAKVEIYGKKVDFLDFIGVYPNCNGLFFKLFGNKTAHRLLHLLQIFVKRQRKPLTFYIFIIHEPKTKASY